MTTAAAPARRSRPRGHYHLPSVHVRKDGIGFDYEENLFFDRNEVRREITFAVVRNYEVETERHTFDIFVGRERDIIIEWLPLLMDEDNPEAQEEMQRRAQDESLRQARIMSGQESSCACCGCSDSRACSGGCVWATRSLCSRCVR